MAKSVRAAMSTSAKLESEGTFLEMGNTRVRLARAGGTNHAFNAAIQAAHKKWGRAIELDVLPDERSRELLYDIYARHVVKSWETDTAPEGSEPDWREGIEGPQGVEPATVENIVAFFTDVPDFFLECKKHAEGSQFYRQALLDEAVKN